MIKTVILCVFLFVPLLGFSQIQSGEVTYSVVMKEGITSSNLQHLRFEQELRQELQGLQLRLRFNRTKSQFRLVQTLPFDYDDVKAQMAINTVNGNDNYYTDINQRKIIHDKDFLGNSVLILIMMDDQNWKLTQESKRIGEYLCYKAIGQEKFFDKRNEPLILFYNVWYCPELPYSFGPYKTSGLPGLVLEMELGRFTYSATDISFSNDEVKIDIPNSDQIITKTEFDSIYLNKARDLMRNGM